MTRAWGNTPAVFGLLLALSSAANTRGQTTQCSGILSSPGDASLRLDLKGGQTVFRQGEIIALTAKYTADSSKKYLVNTRNYDRIGRLSGEEVFCLEPDRGSDPLEDYFHSVLGGMGGIFSELGSRAAGADYGSGSE